jgi:hypothetical protein
MLTSIEGEGWMLCGQQTIFHCIFVPSIVRTLSLTKCSQMEVHILNICFLGCGGMTNEKLHCKENQNKGKTPTEG